MPPESAKYFQDMLDAIESIEQISKHKSFDDYVAQKILRDAVQWNFCILGEALSQLEKIDPASA